jgi:hypothetical protein
LLSYDVQSDAHLARTAQWPGVQNENQPRINTTGQVLVAPTMTTLEAPSEEHQRLVQALANYLKSNGWAVTHADGIANFPRPYDIEGRIPDIIAKNQIGLLAYGEAETCESLEEEQTIDQLEVFSNRRMRDSGQIVPLFVIVPAACSGRLANLVATRFPDHSNIARLYL